MSDKINDSEDFLAKWLSGELSPEEQSQFEASAEGKEFMSIVDSVEKVALPTYDVEAELNKLKTKQNETTKTETKVIQFPNVFKYAAAAVIIIGVSLVYFLTSPSYEVYETIAGQIETIVLPDKSVVTLNANSKLKFDPETFSDNRELQLEGEAFFEVTKGINFEVVTDQGTVKVLGTSFNVWNRQNLLDVICYTGSVNVSKKSYAKDLTPGDGIRLMDGTLKRTWVKEVAVGRPLWITNAITELESVTIKEALNELSNVYALEIKSNKTLDAIPYTGTFPNDDLETAIRQVLRTSNIEYTYNATSKKLVLTGTKGQ